jgi:hypothetical protein
MKMRIREPIASSLENITASERKAVARREQFRICAHLREGELFEAKNIRRVADQVARVGREAKGYIR